MTTIEWTDATWNPVTGCTKVSAGCKHCYAERVAQRFWKGRKFTDVQTHPDRLDQPLRWRKPRRVFVNSMSDLFHEAVPDHFLRLVFAVMASAPDHTFQVLTKRPQRMRDFLRAHDWRAALAPVVFKNGHRDLLFHGLAKREQEGGVPAGPPPNVWLGVSCEDQETADERIPLLLDTPAAVRFVSCEPLLGPIDLGYRGAGGLLVDGAGSRMEPQTLAPQQLDWIIVGGESGPGARPCDVAWIRSIVEQCRAAGVACFVKQLGANPFCGCGCGVGPEGRRRHQAACARTGLDLTDSRAWKGSDPAEWPEDLRVRQWPEKHGLHR